MPFHIAVFVVAMLPLPRPTVSQFILASAVVTILPVLHASTWRRNASMLFLRNTTSMLSVVPRKLVVAFVPALPRRDHPEAGTAAHRAFPVASEVRT